MSQIVWQTDKNFKTDALVIGVFQKSTAVEKKKETSGGLLFRGKKRESVQSLLSHVEKAKFFSGKKNETGVLRFNQLDGFSNVVLLGLGDETKWSSEMARQAGAALAQMQRKEHFLEVSLELDSLLSEVPAADQSYFLQAFSEGYGLSGYEFTELKKKETEKFKPKGIQLMGTKNSRLEKSIVKGGTIVEAVNFARSLGDRPGNVLTPTAFALLAQKMAKECGLKCTVLGKKEIEKEKMGLLLGVAQGSNEEPKIIILEHKGTKKARPVALVGKGITFDSGGISLKPAARMEDMKYDMMGAAAVAGIMMAVSKLQVAQPVIAYIAASENLPGGKAQKPGDVMKSSSGKTVEIINTDAEGRLILADALEYAQKQEPQAIVDFATLTGAVVDALGTVAVGIMGNHQGLLDRIKQASTVTSEKVWQLPLFEEYEEDLKSSVADIKNSGVREAGSSKGGTFLKFFVDSKVPWVHCDIAGCAYHRKDVNYHPTKYASGVMVRLGTLLLEEWKTL